MTENGHFWEIVKKKYKSALGKLMLGWSRTKEFHEFSSISQILHFTAVFHEAYVWKLEL